MQYIQSININIRRIIFSNYYFDSTKARLLKFKYF